MDNWGKIERLQAAVRAIQDDAERREAMRIIKQRLPMMRRYPRVDGDDMLNLAKGQ